MKKGASEKESKERGVGKCQDQDGVIAMKASID
jgi:hypothetical protein